MKDATRLFWAGLVGLRGQRAEELLPVDALPHGSAAALCQGLLTRPPSLGGSRLALAPLRGLPFWVGPLCVFFLA